MVTVNEHGPPLLPKQRTFVVPIGKTDPPGGLQTTVPQPVPLPDGVEKSYTFPHCPVSGTSVTLPWQVTSQVAGEIVTEAVNVLSVANNSAVSLETVAVLVTVEPACAPGSTLKTKVSCAVVPAGRVAIVQVELPSVLLTSGSTQLKAGPVTCVSVWNDELVATVTDKETFDASFGPLFVTNTLNGALEPGDTWKGAEIGHQRSTAA